MFRSYTFTFVQFFRWNSTKYSNSRNFEQQCVKFKLLIKLNSLRFYFLLSSERKLNTTFMQIVIKLLIQHLCIYAIERVIFLLQETLVFVHNIRFQYSLKELNRNFNSTVCIIFSSDMKKRLIVRAKIQTDVVHVSRKMRKCNQIVPT